MKSFSTENAGTTVCRPFSGGVRLREVSVSRGLTV